MYSNWDNVSSVCIQFDSPAKFDVRFRFIWNKAPIALFNLRLQLSFQTKFCCTMSPRSRCDCTGLSLALHKCASRFPLMLRVCDYFVFGICICIKPGLDMLSVALFIAT